MPSTRRRAEEPLGSDLVMASERPQRSWSRSQPELARRSATKPAPTLSTWPWCDGDGTRPPAGRARPPGPSSEGPIDRYWWLPDRRVEEEHEGQEVPPAT